VDRRMAHLREAQEGAPVNRWSTFLQLKKGTKGTIETVTGAGYSLQVASSTGLFSPGDGLAAGRFQRSEEGSNGVT